MPMAPQHDVLGLLVDALLGDQLPVAILADALKEAGYPAAADKLHMLFSLAEKVRQRLKQTQQELDELEEEWGEFGPRDTNEVEDDALRTAAIEAYTEILAFLGEKESPDGGKSMLKHEG
jgi:hypothetical protein